jgi:hypothetical protein
MLRLVQLVIDELPLRVSLYKNDRTPKWSDTLAMYTLADFSGYSGFIAITGWSPPAMLGERAKITAAACNWAHNGGPTDNFIYGVVVTDNAGGFVWAERFSGAPITVTPATPNVGYVPVLTDTAEYPG